jgi:predicted small metal-binding protein
VTESWTLRESGVKRYLRGMRVLDCDCGQTLQAGNDEDLFKEARAHVDQEHADKMTDDQVRDLVSRAYEASDS